MLALHGWVQSVQSNPCKAIFAKNRALGSGLWALGSGLWALGSGLWALGSGLWALGSGLWALFLKHLEESVQDYEIKNQDPN